MPLGGILFSHFNPIHLHHLHNACFEKKLGEGSFGKVKIYKCKETDCNGISCDSCFVVKTIKVYSKWSRFLGMFSKNNREKIKYVDERLLEILLNEWNVGKDLDHPNIIKTLDIDIQKMSLILEYYESIDLFTYVTHNIFEYPLKTKNQYSIEIFKQILSGVDYLHQSGIVHMDLKLENIIIDPNSRIIKIIDFGKAIIISKNKDQDLWLRRISECEWGTLQYLPPECFLETEYVNLKMIDTWACGILLYNLIYNSTPWNIACANKDLRYHNFIKYIDYNILVKNIFPDLYNHGWSISDIRIINSLFYRFYTQDSEKRITIKTAIKELDKLTT